MNNNKNMKIFELSFTILENWIKNENISSKENLVNIANKAVAIAKEKKDKLLSEAYDAALDRLNGLSLDEIKEIKEVLED